MVYYHTSLLQISLPPCISSLMKVQQNSESQSYNISFNIRNLVFFFRRFMVYLGPSTSLSLTGYKLFRTLESTCVIYLVQGEVINFCQGKVVNIIFLFNALKLTTHITFYQPFVLYFLEETHFKLVEFYLSTNLRFLANFISTLNIET